LVILAITLIAICEQTIYFLFHDYFSNKNTIFVNSLTIDDGNQIKEAFINGGRGHPPSHLKFFLLVFSKLKEDIK